MKRWRAKGPTVQAERKGERRSERTNESGRTLCFISNFNIYRLYPERISICIYPPSLSFLATTAAVTGFTHAYAQPPRTSFSVLFRLTAPSRSPTVLSDNYRVISTADFRVASSHTHAYMAMISALICSTVMIFCEDSVGDFVE